MGIQGLLPFVDKACKSRKLSDFHGWTLAVDASCWLHKGTYGCATKLACGEQTNFYVQYCLRQVKNLLSYGIKLILVFDGASLPAKKQTNETRKQRRELALEKGHRSLAEGNHDEANGFFRQSMNITSEMVGNVIEACISLNNPDVTCLVAPYEADAQLTYLNLNGYADAVLSEDSDLIVFGCKKIIFKSDDYKGTLYDKDDLLEAVFGERREFDFELFRRICILSGCDYAGGLQGFGLATAKKFFQKVASSSKRDIKSCLKRIPMIMNMKTVKVTQDYVDQFVSAENTFLYQLVFDPEKHCLTPLHPYADGLEADSMPYAGKLLDAHIAHGISTGALCPRTHRPRERSIGRERQTPSVPLVKKRSPRKSPSKSPYKSPRKSATQKSAFETGHIRNVVRPRVTTQRAAPKFSDFTFEKSVTLSIYDSAPPADQSITRSRYFTSTSSPVAPTPPPSSKKRSLFDNLDNTDEDDGGFRGNEQESEESGFFDSSQFSSYSSTSSQFSTPNTSKCGLSKKRAFTFRKSQEIVGGSQIGSSPILSAFTGLFTQNQ